MAAGSDPPLSGAADEAVEGGLGVRSARPRWRLGIGAAIVLALVVLSGTVGVALWRAQQSPVETISGAAPTAVAGSGTAVSLVYVHVLGAVVRPGLYALDENARVAEAVAAAGGTADGADLRSVNLARVVTDGEQIVIGAEGSGEEPSGGATLPGSGGTGTAGGLVDLNSADVATLDTLPRVGPAIAARIIEWREANGRFTSVDDLLAVPGIGDKLLAGIRDRVRV